MAITILPKAREVLSAPATPAPTPQVQASPEPAQEVKMALWALPARHEETLYLIQKKTGEMLRVIDYLPSKNKLVLFKESIKFEFLTQCYPDMDKHYTIFWR